ncbi:hypothetical protein [Taibaiella helva]|uniref:hypothetical protein n=1 Tax=Taibaiella helva TaxID=2301235 RepID=UPI001300965F|nr:hypothetical protein [Taibaiella helva]
MEASASTNLVLDKLELSEKKDYFLPGMVGPEGQKLLFQKTDPDKINENHEKDG